MSVMIKYSRKEEEFRLVRNLTLNGFLPLT
jgi:hypothetical protein